MSSLYPVIGALEDCQTSAASFIVTLLTDQAYENLMVNDLVARAEMIFKAFIQHHATHDKILQWCFGVVEATYLREVQGLASGDSGLHFGVASVTVQQLEEFQVKEMARTVETHAPRLWNMLDSLLQEKQGLAKSGSLDNVHQSNEDLLLGGADEFWNAVDEIDLKGFIDYLTQTGHGSKPLSIKERNAKWRSAIQAMKKTVICSILMQGINQKANALQSIVRFFLQSVHAPYNVINTLAHLGVSISTDAINLAVRSLSLESEHALRSLGHSLLASYAYDNFDIDLKSQVPTVKKSNDSLKHLTLGLLFLLEHGVVPDDLRCSEELWKRSPLNLDVGGQHPRTWWDLVNPHEASPQTQPTNTKQPAYQQFNAWMFLHDLCTYGPKYFQQFKPKITHPEPIEQIPLVKTPIFAACAMDINNSTVSGNIHAVIELLKQGEIYEAAQKSGEDKNIEELANEDSVDISEHVILIHGDLGTGEHLLAAQLRHSIESTPWHQFQHVVFIPGLFHLKMACVDALWRCFILPSSACEDETSLMNDVAMLHPRETYTFAMKPGFRQMHELVSHAGICRRLNCWLVYIQGKMAGITSLDDFASTRPTLEDLRSMANEIAQQFIATHQIQRMRKMHEETRDIQYENSLLLNKYFLLYEELSYAMNCGDIGRVESCIIDWISVLKAIGKHKYATHMQNFLLNVHFVYPPGLKRAVCYHLLVNLTGQTMKWQAVDWCVELNNLFTKVKNGGKGPNRTVEWITLESPLVQVYRNVQKIVQTNFNHTHLNANHTAPDITKTFRKLQEKLSLSSLHIVHRGRKSRHVIEDLSDKGLAMLEKMVQGELNANEEGTEVDKAELQDVLIELV